MKRKNKKKKKSSEKYVIYYSYERNNLIGYLIFPDAKLSLSSLSANPQAADVFQ